MKNYLLLFILSLIVMGTSCELGKPRAQGADNELIIVSSEEHKNKISSLLSLVFNDTIFTPQPEPHFNQIWVTPDKFSDIKKNVNIIVANIGNDSKNDGTKLIKNILSAKQYESSIFGDNNLIFSQNVFAKDQNFLIINGPTTEKIINTANEKGPWIEKQFDKLFVKRQSNYLLKGSSRQLELEKSLALKYNWTMKIPWGYTIISDSSSNDFFWMGREMPYRWLAVQWMEGLQFSDSVSAAKYSQKIPINYFNNIQYSNYYFDMQPYVFNELGAWRITGLWESSEDAQGGPFLSYLFYNPNDNRTYFIHTMIFYPGKEKFLLLKQLDIIAQTFKTVLQ